MSLRLHQTKIQCSKDGENLFRVTRFIYDLGQDKNIDIEEDPVCRKCDPQRYYEILKHVDRIEPLIPTGEVQNTKKGKIERTKEQEAK